MGNKFAVLLAIPLMVIPAGGHGLVLEMEGLLRDSGGRRFDFHGPGAGPGADFTREREDVAMDALPCEHLADAVDCVAFSDRREIDATSSGAEASGC